MRRDRTRTRFAAACVSACLTAATLPARGDDGAAAYDAPAPAAPAAPAPATQPATPAPTAVTRPAAATRPADAEVAAGHSMHGEAFDEGPRQAAYLMGGTGKVRFPVTTASPDAQKFFEQGVGQLHGFWYFEAERSFRQAAALDPDCAMAYWGMAMANAGNEKRAKEFIKAAAQRKGKVSRREALWIDGLNDYYHGTEKDEAKRRRNHIRSIETVVQEFPEDVEAKALLAWRIWDSRSRLPIPSLQSVDALLDQVFQAEPMHPAHHYRIHLWDDEKPARAAASAARCGQSSPSVAHMWHMPGHTYSKLHRYEDAVFQQEASARVDHARMIRDRVMPYQIHNYAHNNEWCVRNLVYVGRAGAAADLARNMTELPRHPKYNDAAKGGSAAAMGRDRLADVLTLHEMWEQFVALADTIYPPGEAAGEQRVRRLRYLGVAHAALGRPQKADELVAELKSLAKEGKPADGKAADGKASDGWAALARARDTAKAAVTGNRSGRADATTRPADPANPQTRPQNRSRRGGNAGDAPAGVDKAIAHIQGAQAFAAGDFKAALEHFEKAGDLKKEHLAQAHLATGNAAKAEQLAREAADGAKGQCYPLANQVDVLARSGKKAEAEEAFKRLRALSSRIDLSVPLYARLGAFAKELGYPADWRLPRSLPDDLVPRPDIDSLGPFRWHPSAAPHFALPGPDGKTISLSDYRGRPVLVVFYLGHGCPHCIEQLNAFEPVAGGFRDADVSIVAVSTDARDGLGKSLDALKFTGGFPFPLVSDESLAAFKAYRAYDDFEKKPLHGTFLIDGQGLVRWQDVSYEPFKDTKFLLAEAKRLLAQSTEGVRETAGVSPR